MEESVLKAYVRDRLRSILHGAFQAVEVSSREVRLDGLTIDLENVRFNDELERLEYVFARLAHMPANLGAAMSAMLEVTLSGSSDAQKRFLVDVLDGIVPVAMSDVSERHGTSLARPSWRWKRCPSKECRDTRRFGMGETSWLKNGREFACSVCKKVYDTPVPTKGNLRPFPDHD